MNRIQDRIRGCLIGGAVGDALGYPVEFMNYVGILANFGQRGITRYKLTDGVAQISDDTQMTLYTANGLQIGDFKTAYLEWYRTQTNHYEPNSVNACWISNIPELYSRRAPGMTCMSALRYLRDGIKVRNNSKGCGGIMRVAPIALWGLTHGWSNLEVANAAFEAARITHHHALGWLPAGILVYTLKTIIENNISNKEGLLDIFDPNSALVDGFKPETVGALDKLINKTNLAIKLALSNSDDQKSILRLGQGWTGEEAWGIAFYCTLKYFEDPEKAIIAAVNHSGDSDSTGAITGHFMGAIHGYDAIPEHFKRNLELHDIILKMADSLIAK